ncbi:hypothetical protein [Hymenobacter ruricola]|uniref:WG repeat-containing protein n=1 Tax=Hymenobacter ruricola TaxID=2791023 RepID=A0ABS0IB82_9BACT|nr:hypothetical protein [Hymenobacter ruricola]MBF9224210.1 hypothetical protein [Hymenobacter ruricola]
MKPLPKIACTALLGLLALVVAPQAQAQVSVNVNTAPPAWGPPVPQGTQFYYIPEIDGYYDLYAQQYIVFQNGQWVALPYNAVGYDPYAFHPVIIDYRGRQPWVYVNAHRDRYPRRVVVVQPVRRVGPPPGQVRRAYREGYQQGRHDDNRGNGNHNGHSRPRRD